MEMDTESQPEQDLEVLEETEADAETIAYEACDAMDEAQEATQTAIDETAGAVVELEKEDVTDEKAQAIVDDASNSVDTAGAELQIAEEKYNHSFTCSRSAMPNLRASSVLISIKECPSFSTRPRVFPVIAMVL